MPKNKRTTSRRKFTRKPSRVANVVSSADLVNVDNLSKLGSISAATAIAGGLFSGVFPVIGIASAILGTGASAYFLKRKLNATKSISYK